jgi:CheY-like chemotaxis protein
MTNSPKNSPVILIIDDEKAIRGSVRNFLEDYDYLVLEAENGRIGIDIFEKEKPDLAIVDLRMPELDGLEVLAAIKKNHPIFLSL